MNDDDDQVRSAFDDGYEMACEAYKETDFKPGEWESEVNEAWSTLAGRRGLGGQLVAEPRPSEYSRVVQAFGKLLYEVVMHQAFVGPADWRFSFGEPGDMVALWGRWHGVGATTMEARDALRLAISHDLHNDETPHDGGASDASMKVAG